MAGTSLLALIDDIATTLDDVAVMTKVAAKKTAGVLGDDLALNAQQVSGVHADRELPVVWAVAKGSMVNKAILIPVALLISEFVPFLVTPLLMSGGLYLCFEGFEKVYEKFFHKPKSNPGKQSKLQNEPISESVMEPASETEPALEIGIFEREKIKGAVRTDFILSAEIIVITLGSVATDPLLQRILVLVSIGLVMTVGVYGLVAGIVKIDDFGLWLMTKSSRSIKKIGQSIVGFAPWLMKFLGIAGTGAMFLVGGGILTHGNSFLHQQKESFGPLGGATFDLFSGVLAGGAVFTVVFLGKKFRSKK